MRSIESLFGATTNERIVKLDGEALQAVKDHVATLKSLDEQREAADRKAMEIVGAAIGQEPDGPWSICADYLEQFDLAFAHIRKSDGEDDDGTF